MVENIEFLVMTGQEQILRHCRYMHGVYIHMLA